MPLTHSRLENEENYQALRVFLIENERLSTAPADATIGDMDWWRAGDDNPESWREIELWWDGGRVVGFAWIGDDGADHAFLPGYPQLQREIVEWALAQADKPLEFYCNATDGERAAVLRSFGYTEREGHVITWQRDLAEPPMAQTRDGFSFSTMAEYGDHADRVDAHRDAFAPSRFSVEKYQRVRQMPTYRSDLDLVLLGPDGKIAAYTIIWLDTANELMLFEPVGCRSGFQRQGLTKWLLHEGMRRGFAAGARRVRVNSGVSDEQLPAQALYASIGCSHIDTVNIWRRQDLQENPT